VVVLDDGKGTGVSAEVNSVNQLRIRSTTHTEEHWVSESVGDTYVASVGATGIDSLTFLTTESGDVFQLINNNTTNMVVSLIAITASAPGGILTLVKNKIQGTLTQNTQVTPTNLNFGSAKIANATVNVWDETNGNGIQGLSGGIVFRTIITPSTFFANTAGTLVLPQGTSLTINYNNITGSTIEFECGVRFYYDTETTQ